MYAAYVTRTPSSTVWGYKRVPRMHSSHFLLYAANPMLDIAAIGLNQGLSTNALNVSLAAANGECQLQEQSMLDADWVMAQTIRMRSFLSRAGHLQSTSCFTRHMSEQAYLFTMDRKCCGECSRQEMMQAGLIWIQTWPTI